MGTVRKIIVVFTVLFSFQLNAQTEFAVDTTGYYSSKVVDEVKQEKFMLYFFLRGDKDVYFLKSSSALTEQELHRWKVDLASVENKGIYMFYEDGKIIIRTNNKEASKEEHLPSEFHVLQGGFNENKELVLKYTSNKTELQNIVFEHHQ